ncbi:hypothetical protein HK101_000307 [Irineochytrium annulatum]|nr:hypothetical protein HK101_000307 [Irineochytrium annulatum]
MVAHLFIVIDVLIAFALIRIARYKLGIQAAEEWPEHGGEQLDLGPVVAEEKEDAAMAQGMKDTKKVAVGKVVTNVETDGVDPTKPVDVPVSPLAIGLAYLLSPYSIATCLGRSTASFNSLAVILSIYFVIKGHISIDV